MKRLAIVLFLFLSYSSPAQTFYAGAGMAFSTQSRNAWITDSVSLSTSNEEGRKFIVPHIGVVFSANEKIKIQTEIAYRRHTISLQYWNNRADTCRLCPVRKGGGPSIDEFRLTGRLNYEIITVIPKISITAGLSAILPFNKEGNANLLPLNLQRSAHAAEKIRTYSIAYDLGIMFEYKFLQVQILKSFNPSYTSTFKIDNKSIPFGTTEHMWQYRLNILFLKREH